MSVNMVNPRESKRLALDEGTGYLRLDCVVAPWFAPAGRARHSLREN